MKKFKWAVLCVALLLGGCTQKDELGVDALQQSTTAKERLYAIKQVGQPGVATKGVAVNGKTWEPGSTIKIKFLNGDAAIQAKVKQYAAEWLQYANLKFEYVGAGDNADVKVGFEWGDEFPYISWSTIGTDCQQVPQDEASLNFVGLEGEEDYDFVRSEVLRGFGHILGLGFEHRNPNSPIVFKYTTATEKNRLASYFGLSMDDILEHIIPLYEVDHTNYTEYDSESIMLLPIPGTFLTNPKFGTAQNLELSETDKTFIAGLYPKYYLKETNIWSAERGVAANGQLYLQNYYTGITHFDKDHNLTIDVDQNSNLRHPSYINVSNRVIYFTQLDASNTVLDHNAAKIFYLDYTDSKIKATNLDKVYGYCAVEANDGRIYLGTSNGLFYAEPNNLGVLTKKELPYPSLEKCSYYPINNPNPTSISVGSCVKDALGRIYLTVNCQYDGSSTKTVRASYYFDSDGEVKFFRDYYPFEYSPKLVSFKDGGVYGYSPEAITRIRGLEIDTLHKLTSPLKGWTEIEPSQIAGGYFTNQGRLYYLNENSSTELLKLPNNYSIDRIISTKQAVFLLSSYYTGLTVNGEQEVLTRLYCVKDAETTPTLTLICDNMAIHSIVEAFDGTVYVLTRSKVWYFKL